MQKANHSIGFSLADRIIELSDLKRGFIEVCEYLGIE
jgi:hypothetical protein